MLPDMTMSSTFPDKPPSLIQASPCIHVAVGCVRSEGIIHVMPPPLNHVAFQNNAVLLK